jgi:hypothetical protein
MKNILGEERLRRARFEIPNLTDVEAAHIRHGTSLAAVRRARKHNVRRGIKFKKSQ